jgi:hypothetical protein
MDIAGNSTSIDDIVQQTDANLRVQQTDANLRSPTIFFFHLSN